MANDARCIGHLRIDSATETSTGEKDKVMVVHQILLTKDDHVALGAFIIYPGLSPLHGQILGLLVLLVWTVSILCLLLRDNIFHALFCLLDII